jgi:hypothetical protein
MLQIPADQYRFNYVKTTVRVHRYRDGTQGVFHGLRKLTTYDQQGKIIAVLKKKVTVHVHSAVLSQQGCLRYAPASLL